MSSVIDSLLGSPNPPQLDDNYHLVVDVEGSEAYRRKAIAGNIVEINLIVSDKQVIIGGWEY